MLNGLYYKHFLLFWIFLALSLKLALELNTYFSSFRPGQAETFCLVVVALALPASVLLYATLKAVDAIEIYIGRRKNQS